MALTDTSTLGEARAWLRVRVANGEKCPCCTQFAKVYKRPLNSGMALLLILLHRASAGHGEWVHVPTFLASQSGTQFRNALSNREWAKLAYWGLLEERPHDPAANPNTKNSGYWRVTPLGHQFASNQVSVKKYAKIYDSRCLGFSDDEVTITEALGTKFSYAELMGR